MEPCISSSLLPLNLTFPGTLNRRAGYGLDSSRIVLPLTSVIGRGSGESMCFAVSSGKAPRFLLFNGPGSSLVAPLLALALPGAYPLRPGARICILVFDPARCAHLPGNELKID